MTIKAIIFDVDGTLADTEDGHRKSFNQAFAECGLDWNWDVALYGKLLKVTGGKERIKHFVQTCLPDFPLPADFQLETYRIERQLSHGGFSIVYLAHDAEGTPVAIRSA